MARPQRGCGVRGAGSNGDLAGEQQLAGGQDRLAVVHPLGGVHLVARPRQVDAPHLTGLPAEALLAGDQHERCVVPGPALAVLADVGADDQRQPLGHPLVALAAREAEQLGRVRRDGEGGRQVVEVVRRRAGVGQRRVDPHDAPARQRDRERDRDPGGLVGGVEAHPVGDRLVTGRGQPRHVARAGPAPDDAGASEPALRLDGQQRRDARDAERAVAASGTGRLRERGQLAGTEAPQVVSPVQDPGEPGGPAGLVLEHEADAAAAEVDPGPRHVHHPSDLLFFDRS